MPLEYQHQISILKDILSNHQTDCCGSVAECEQMERLIKSLMVNSNLNQDFKNVLQDIYSYSQTGKYTQHLNNHIHSHQNQLSAWVNDINQLS